LLDGTLPALNYVKPGQTLGRHIKQCQSNSFAFGGNNISDHHLATMKKFAVEELVPHSGKMVLLDRVIEFDEENMVAELIVRDDGLFW